MPWIDAEVTIPPINTEILVVDSDGSVNKRMLRDVDVYDGRGGTNKTMPLFWQQCNGNALAPIPSRSGSGLGHMVLRRESEL